MVQRCHSRACTSEIIHATVHPTETMRYDVTREMLDPCHRRCCASDRAARYERNVGSDSSRGPRPYTQRQTSTVFVRVPRAEWAPLTVGVKREFRAAGGKHSALWNVHLPSPAVAYTINSFGTYDSSMMVLEDVWREPLGAISSASLAAEGFDSIGEFRRHWMEREHSRFLPLRMTTVYRMRPWTEDDDREMARVLLGRLYGDFLPSRHISSRSPDGVSPICTDSLRARNTGQST